MTDYTLEDTLYILFTTRAFATGVPGTLGGSPVVSAYENDSVTQITAGITLGVDHDSVTGLNLLTIAATAANGYENGKDYSLVITTGTVGGVSVVGEVVGSFTIGRSAAAVDLANATDGLGAIKADTAAILTDTAEIGAAGAGLTDLGGMSTAMKAEVNAEADTALSDYDAPTNAEMTTAFTEIKGATWASGTDTLEAIRDRGDAAWITATGFSTHAAADVWSVATRLLTAGTNIVLAKGVGVTGFNDLSAAQVNAEVDTAFTDYDPATHTELIAEIDSVQTDIAALNDPTAAAIADAVWDEAQADHVAAGSFGVTASEIASILVDTAEIGAAGAGLTDLGGMSTGMKAEVNAEVVDTLNVDTYGEPGQGAPPATASIVAKINYIFKGWRNKSDQTATTYQLYADDGITVDQKATVSDDGTTATKGEIATGP